MSESDRQLVDRHQGRVGPKCEDCGEHQVLNWSGTAWLCESCEALAEMLEGDARLMADYICKLMTQRQLHVRWIPADVYAAVDRRMSV